MKIICSKDSLLKVLQVAENVISTKNSISILSNILIEAYKDTVKISASETKLNFYAEISADVVEEGSISIHSNKFYSIARKLPGDEILVTTDDNHQLRVQPNDNDKINYTLKGIDSGKFPEIMQIEDVPFSTISQEIITQMTKRTIFAISQNENRRFVSGIYFESTDNDIKMVATDGKRLSLVKKDIQIGTSIENGIIIPPKILTETLKLCTGNGDVQIGFSDKNIFVKIDNFSFISNLLEGNFPPYEKVIPNDQTISFSVNKKIFYDALDRISQISDKESHKITLLVNDSEMKIYTEDITIGSGEEIIPVNYSGDSFNIFLNYTFITDVLNVIKNDNVIFELKNSESIVTVKEENNNDYIYIMMPMSS